MTENQIKARIKFNTELIKLLGLAMLATISGVVTLFYQNPSFGKTFVFGFFGTLLIMLQGFIIYLFYKKNVNLISQL
jgi:hypothetical protein